MEIGRNFKSINLYTESMSKHMKDKLFWASDFYDKSYVIVDFGCADGSTINYLCDFNKDNHSRNTYIGYDISETMIEIAKGNFNGNDKEDVVFTSSWDVVSDILKTHEHETKILFLSSVIHEVYSYAKTTDEIDAFWNKVLHTGFDYIIVRDMMVTYDTIKETKPNDLKRIQIPKYEKQLKEFEEKHGSCKTLKNFMHFLLKYHWKVNWEREVNEDYFPLMVEDFLEIMMYSCYNLDYFKRFRVPFLDEKIKKDFNGIVLTDYTHIKAVFSKKKY